jgi:phosphorylcholine metabolism protein LicD
MSKLVELLSSTKQKGEIIKLEQCYINDLYTMMHFLNTVFSKYGIVYTAMSGTLLGAVREQQLIAHDDDIDIAIFEQDEELLLALKPLFKEYGYGMIKYMGNYKFYKLNGEDICKRFLINFCVPFKFPFVDIFVYKQDKNKFIFNDIIPRMMFPKEYFYIKNLFPLRPYKFGPLVVLGPNNPIDYLDRAYGDDWMTVRRQTLSHKDLSFSNNEEVITEFIPALPTFTVNKNFNI